MQTELAAGRELDALVAEQVMGCKPVADSVLGYRCTCGYPAPHRDPRDDGEYGEGSTVLAYYSTDIAPAWLIIYRFDSYEVKWDAYVKQHTCMLLRYKPLARGYGEGSTPELAICRAALASAVR